MKVAITQDRVNAVVKLAEQEPTRVELCEHLQLSQGAVSALVRYCCKLGLISCTKGTQGRGAIPSRITLPTLPSNPFAGWGGAQSLGLGSSWVLDL